MHIRNVRSNNIIKQLRQQLSKQKSALQDAQSVSDARNLFLAGLSHELRTPLSGIMGVAELLKSSGLNNRQLEYARMVNWASTTVLEIVDDMLTFSRIHTGKLHLESVPFCISTVIDNMLAMQNIRAQERGVALVRDVAANIPKIVMGDRGKLNQILLNLIGNAIKFTDEGSIIVRAELQKSGTHTNANGSIELVFTVIDTGIGMEQASVANMLKPFVQGKNQYPDHDRGGTGLGLSICRRLVEAMDGNISVVSTLGQGTSVRFCLPFMVPDTCTVNKETKTTAGSDSFFTVLVIEDDEINRLVCTRYLALSGHHPVTAASASQAMQLLNKWQGRPDLILLDMNLSGYSGASLYKEMRSARNGLWDQVPVIAISADVSGASQEQAINAGISDFMAKPFSAGQLQAKILDVLNNAGTSRNKVIPVQINHSDYRGLLDKQFIQQELADLGDTVMLELLNMFRSSSASILQNLAEAVQRRDYSLTRTHVHKLQGSASNLGMVKVMNLASNINNMARDHEQLDFDALEALVLELEQCCHASSDAMRTLLSLYSDQRVALAAHGYY